jgi:SSS family solute:Na+ symporter
MYSAHTEKGALWSMVTSGLVVIIFSAVIGIAGMYTYKLYPNLTNADEALPWLVMNVLPPWLAAFVVVAVVSGMSSAANGCAAAAGTFFVRHIYPLVTGHYPSDPVRTARIALACAFLASTLLALYTSNIVSFVVKFLPLTMSGLGVVILLGRFWKHATWQGALAALISTPLVSLSIILTPTWAKFWGNPTIPAASVGLVAHVVVSLLTPRTRRSIEEVAETLGRERQSIEGASLHGRVASEQPHSLSH